MLCNVLYARRSISYFIKKILQKALSLHGIPVSELPSGRSPDINLDPLIEHLNSRHGTGIKITINQRFKAHLQEEADRTGYSFKYGKRIFKRREGDRYNVEYQLEDGSRVPASVYDEAFRRGPHIATGKVLSKITLAEMKQISAMLQPQLSIDEDDIEPMRYDDGRVRAPESVGLSVGEQVGRSMQMSTYVKEQEKIHTTDEGQTLEPHSSTIRYTPLNPKKAKPPPEPAEPMRPLTPLHIPGWPPMSMPFQQYAWSPYVDPYSDL